jgi:hypothetical protein
MAETRFLPLSVGEGENGSLRNTLRNNSGRIFADQYEFIRCLVQSLPRVMNLDARELTPLGNPRGTLKAAGTHVIEFTVFRNPANTICAFFKPG